MCFSANASFGAGIVLSAIGVITIKKAQSSSQLFFASIPLIFGVQQITEGFIWLSLVNPTYSFLKYGAIYIFLFFAQVVWPIWVPYSILKFESTKKQGMAAKLLVIIGAIVSLYLAYCLLTFPVDAKTTGSHISYIQHYPSAISKYCGFLYIVSTILPSFISVNRRMWLLGTSIFISYLITTIFYTDYVVSVWCFFASIISIVILTILQDQKHSPKYKKIDYPAVVKE
ncbi:MAG: hypothetical protein K9G36_03685 [Crocinitomicaceae bacterium]|jgi:hypothetical protein|nr:hypothetical protein [Crocinitomicaceae bacterium]MCF8409773.1 hypothetical protein [Crocinitomicaceae bacterium]MCF8443477.1 hypothetical protein [Crocinitomicaceae bacterium]